MRVFLRNTETGLYCAGPKRWVASELRALDFTSVPQATRFAFEQSPSGMEIVLISEVLPDQIVVPVIPEWCGQACLHEERRPAETAPAPAAALDADG